VSGKILPDALERQDEPLFPLVALREALVNALCHRTYDRAGGAISVALFDDRLEIWSDGTLPFDLRPEDLKKDHQSQPRNPLITNVFYRKGLIEQWGRGTQKIVELCVKVGHPEPEFLEQAGSVIVRFIPSGYVAPTRVAHNLSDRQRQILQLLAEKKEQSFTEIKKVLPNPPADRTLRDDFQHLKRLNLISSRGRGGSARWYLI
jgi:ATP-dependent DNA helicase RecG